MVVNKRDVIFVLCDVGNVHVFLKDSKFQASFPTQHPAELGMLMKKFYSYADALILFTDGGPDHNNKHTSVRLGLLALFLELDMATIVVIRTAPTQSWANPVERVMSVLNLGLHGVALAREEMVEEYKTKFKKGNGMKVVRKLAQEYVQVEDVVNMPIEEEEVAHVAKGEHRETPTTRIEEEDNAVLCKLDADSVGDSNKGTAEPRLESDEARDHAQRIPTITKKGSDVTESNAGDEVVDDMVVPVNAVGQENVDDWFGSDADDEVVREVVAEQSIAKKGNKEPSRIDDPIVVDASLLYQEDDDWLGSNADDEVLRKQVTEENEAEMRHSGTIELTNDGDNPFIDAFFTSI